MHFSPYLKMYCWKDDPDHLLLFSTKQTSKILILKKTYLAAENGTMSPSDAALLTELGMIVPDRLVEMKATTGLIDALNAQNSVLNVTVVLNLDCNFACIYCYEGDMKGRHYMSAQTAWYLVDFIKNRFTSSKKSLIVDFYGGEPLLSAVLIKSISQELKSFAAAKGAEYSFSLVTNGALLKRRLTEELVQLGLDRVKITLDGPAEIHNRYRPFKSGSGSFDTIIKNIKETCDLTKIGIGGNFDCDTYTQFPRLLDCLEKEGLTPDKISAIKFDPISNRPARNLSPTDYNHGCMSINEPWLVESGIYLREEILKRGYHTPKPKPLFCLIENKDAMVVNYDGVIYKCPAFIGQPGYAVGDLLTGVRDYAETYKLDIWKTEKCTECEYLPLCFGGCRYMTFLRNAKIDQLDCQKDYLDATLETLINQDIKYLSPTNSDHAQRPPNFR